MGTLVRLQNAALSDAELLEQILAEIPPPPPGLIATHEERRERYARLAREGRARAAREAFHVVK